MIFVLYFVCCKLHGSYTLMYICRIMYIHCLLQENILQFYPSAYLYKPVDDVLEVKYGLNDLSAIKGSVVGVSVTSDTLNDVRVCFVK